jgi:hypothetical protein
MMMKLCKHRYITFVFKMCRGKARSGMLYAFVELSKGSKKDVIVFTLRHRIPNTSEKLSFWWLARKNTFRSLFFIDDELLLLIRAVRTEGREGKRVSVIKGKMCKTCCCLFSGDKLAEFDVKCGVN